MNPAPASMCSPAAGTRAAQQPVQPRRAVTRTPAAQALPSCLLRPRRRPPLAAAAAAEAGASSSAAATLQQQQQHQQPLEVPPAIDQQQQQQQLEQQQQEAAAAAMGAAQQHAAAGAAAAASGNGVQPPPAAAAAAAAASAAHGARVEVRGMVKHFATPRGVFRAVNGASVAMEPGTITALLGPSGSGKTTLMRLVAGLEEPTAGQVLFDGRDVTGLGVQDRDLGFVFQGYALFRHMTVADNITFGPRMRRMPIDMQAKVEELLRLTDLAGLGGRYPPQLSGGQRQRVAVARALACNPRLLLLDEPFGALDPIVRKSLRHGLRDIVRALGVTTVLVTHDQEEAWDVADRVVIFNKGAIEQQGTPEEIARAPVSPFVMNFVGDVAHLPAACQLVRRMGYQTDKPYVMCRPSDLLVHTAFEGHPRAAPATVHDKVNVGARVRYYLRFDDAVALDFAVARREDAARYDLEVGQRVYVEAPPDALMAFDYRDLDGAAVVVAAA